MTDSSTSFVPAGPQKVAVIGTGHFGNSLRVQIQRAATEYTVSQASRSTQIPISDAIENANIIILAIPTSAFEATVHAIASELREGTIVVDVSNRPLSVFGHRNQEPSYALSLQKLVPPGVHIAKAFNTLSANYLTELNDRDNFFPTNVYVPFAADHPDAIQSMNALIKSMSFIPTHCGAIADTATKLESAPHRLFPDYKGTFILATIVWTWWILYSTLSTYVIHGGRGEPSRPWDKYPLSMFMATTGETAMTLFAITFLAGPVAILFKLFGKRIRGKLEVWLDRRKQLGLVAFLFVGAHGIAGAISASHLDDGWKGQLYFVMGIM